MINKDFPMWIRMGLEINALCNRDCIWCPRFYNNTGVRKDKNNNKITTQMPSQKVFDLIDSVSVLGFRGPIYFHRLSEPFLDKRYVSFARYAKERGIKIHENTNGDVLKGNRKLCSAIDGLIDVINIGIYDSTTVGEVEQEINYWQGKFKKSKVTFSCLSTGEPRIRQNSLLFFTKEKDQSILDRPCFSPRYQLLIRYDGEVSLCCEDDECIFDLGNVFHQSIEDIWWSDKHVDISRKLTKPGGRKEFKLCSNCYCFFGWY